MFKSRKHLVIFCSVLLLGFVLLFSLLAPQFGNSNQSTSVNNPSALYETAAEALFDIHNVQMLVHTQEIIKTKENTIQTASTQTVTHINQDSDDWQLYATEITNIGQHYWETSTILYGQTLYYTLNGVKFTGSCDIEALSRQYPPTIVLDPNLYKNITGIQIGRSRLVFFSEPIQQENWAVTSSADFLDARGIAWINSKGELTKSTYSFSYRMGELTCYKSVTVQIIDQDPYPIVTPVDTEAYQLLNDPLLPMELETTCGYLLQAQNIESNYVNQITCELFGDTRLQNTDIVIKSRTDDPDIEMATTVNITNSSREGEVISSSQIQQYSAGSYSLQLNSDTAVITEGASSQELLTSCQETLVGTILLPQHIKCANSSYSGNVYRIEFTATDEFAQKIISDACTYLYDDPELLDKLSPEHHIDSILCYIEFSMESGLPIKSGIHFLGTYYSSNLPYQLIFKSDQTYYIP